VSSARRIETGTWLQVILVLAIGCFYFWTAVPEYRPGLVARTNESYYNLLTRGFLKGQLSLDEPADPFLATLKDPYDYNARQGHGAHDVTYYRGKYYIYFGVAPVVLLFLPFRLLTGSYLDDTLAVTLFSFGGLVMAVLLLRAVQARYFRGASLPAMAGAVVALGLGNLVPMLLRRTHLWEVPIACGYFCCLTALYAFFQAWHSPRRLTWLAAASAACGCAVGSRPTYLLGCPALLIVLVSLLREERAAPVAGRPLRLIAAALLPIGLIGLGLAAYNYLRFGNPTDFGWRHLLNADPVATAKIFSWPFLQYNLRVYLLAWADWSPFFPYVTMVHLPAQPAGYMVAEDPYGILPNIPFVLLGLATLGLGGLRRIDGRSRLGVFCAAVAVMGLGTGLMTASFAAATNRYMVDFLPALIVLAVLGFLAVVTRPWFRGGIALVAAPALGVLLGYSALFNVLASLRHNELFRAEHAALYQRVARIGNYPSYFLGLLLHHEFGPVELQVIFPRDKQGTVEPLIVTGREFLSDYLFVHYLDADHVRFGVDHTSRGSLVGQAMEIKPGAVQTIRVDFGSLYPPPAHPYFDAMSRDEAETRQETLRVTLNGQVALDRTLQPYDAGGWDPTIGSSGDRVAFKTPFSGRILSWRRMPDALPAVALDPVFGPVRLRVILPRFTEVRSEPLVCSGETGNGDLVYVHYERADRISFGYDHWGKSGMVSPSFAVTPGGTQVIEIEYGGLEAGGRIGAAPAEITGRPLVIRLNGAVVLAAPAAFWTCDPSSVAVATNRIHTSTAVDDFSGTLNKVERLQSP
jgi:hypothetical protein